MPQRHFFSQQAIELTCGNLHVWVNPKNGMNVERIVYEGTDIIFCDFKRREKGATYAVPILYPTPNRVENNQFVFNAKTFCAKMHGVAHLSSFHIFQNTQTSQEHLLSGVLPFDSDSPYYEWFTFPFQLFITIRVLPNRIVWEYTVKNNGSSPCPYSFGLHPFFKKNERVLYQVFAHSMMENTTKKLPTGKLVPLQPPYDVRQPLELDGHAFDHVFCVQNNPMARLYYPTKQLGITICASSQFQRCVVYTPSQQDFFCIEPQTSSTNCHNLHNAGYISEANLQIIPPYRTQDGWISFEFSKDT